MGQNGIFQGGSYKGGVEWLGRQLKLSQMTQLFVMTRSGGGDIALSLLKSFLRLAGSEFEAGG